MGVLSIHIMNMFMEAFLFLNIRILSFFFKVPLVGLQCVIVELTNHTYFFCL